MPFVFQNFNPTLNLGHPGPSPPTLSGAFAENTQDLTPYLNAPHGSNSSCGETASGSSHLGEVKVEHTCQWQGSGLPDLSDPALPSQIAEIFLSAYNNRNMFNQHCASASAYASAVPSPYYDNALTENVAEPPTSSSYTYDAYSLNQPGASAATGPVDLTSITEDDMNFPGAFNFEVGVGNVRESQKVSEQKMPSKRLFRN